MSTISIRSSTQTWSAEGPRVFRIGREVGCDVVAEDPTVSRQHAEIRPVGDGWEVVDLGSSHGTWVNGQRVPRALLTGTTSVSLGAQGGGLALTVTVSGGAPSAPPAAPGTTPAAPGAAYAPVPPPFVPGPPGAPLPPPGARPYAGPPAYQPPPMLAQTIVSGPGARPGPGGQGGPGLLVRRRVGADLRFGTQAPVRVGRDPSFEVVVDDAAVSRLHAVVEPRPDGWWWVDRSTSGSYVDGERITTFRITEPVEILLGHPTAGLELEVVPVVAAGQAAAAIVKKKRRRTLAIVGAAVGALVLIGGGITAAAVLGGGDDQSPVATQGGLSDVALARAKAAAVFLIAVDDTGTPTHSGSGSIISDDGLILTNAHVAEPSAPGQGASETPDPDYLLVSLTSPEDDKPATATFRAEPIVTDGYLDLSVLQIVADADGNALTPGEMDLPEPLPIGSSDDLKTGDEITALGYPSIGNVTASLDRPLTVTRGVVSTFQADEVIGTERGLIDSDVRLGSGNSGGPSINDDGELIGINTAVITAGSSDAGAITQGSALIRPVDLAEEVLRIAEEGGDPAYVSPFVEDLPVVEDPPVDADFQAAGWVRDGEQGECAGESTVEQPQILSVAPGETVYAEYVIAGLADGTPIGVTLTSLDGGTQIGSLQDTWSFGRDAVCIYVPFEVPEGEPGMVGTFVVGEEGQPVVDNPLAFQ
ncbi:FHA domain-containing protein [Nocardioides psychrotolerans]|uniref:FHA domain-containing protein n=1 Tax=Nocardioides psychrotolerans TaxID=1005945 RepID=UPI00313799BE